VLEPSSSIRRQQNDPSMLALLQAVSVSHSRVQRLDAISTSASILTAVLGVVATFVEAMATPATIVGALWALAYSTGLATWTGNELQRAATLQEMFDVRLFSIPWNPVIAAEPLGAQEVSKLSKRFRGRDDMIRDYYEIPDLPRPYDVLACQQQNLGWGSRIRRRYCYSILVVVCGWSVAGLIIGGLADLTIAEVLLYWYLPSLGALMLGVDVFRAQRDVADRRDHVLGLVRARVAAAVAAPADEAPAIGRDLELLARQVQDTLFFTRQHAPRVPDWFFLRFRANDRMDFRAAMDELELMLGLTVRPRGLGVRHGHAT
jgi:hypothetical protein